MSKFFSVPAWSFGGKHQPKIMKNKTPGPGKYAANDNEGDIRNSIKEAYSIPKAERKGQRRETNDLGPGTYYKGYSSLTKNGISFKGGKFVGQKKRKEPGPGDYEVRNELLDEKAGQSFAKSKRKGLTDYLETGDKGPGAYHNNYLNKNPIAAVFGKSGRDSKDPESGKIGPGHYFDSENDNYLSRKGGVINRGDKKYMDLANQITSGDHLGPGYYPQKGAIEAENGFSIGKAGKGSGAKKKRTPGPGQYFSGNEMGHRTFVNGGTFSKAGKLSGSVFGRKKKGVPGPGQYARGMVKKPPGGGYTFGREKRGWGGKGSGVGPGQYSKQNAKYGTRRKRPKSAGTFGTSGRFGKKGKNASSRVVEVEGTYLGPGSYNSHKAGKSKKGWSMGKANRKFLDINDKNPGPGEYKAQEVRIGVKRGYTFNNASRGEKKKKKGGKHYNIKGTIPDVADYLLPPHNQRKIKHPDYT